MSDTVVAERRPRARKAAASSRSTRRTVDTSSLREYLTSLDLGYEPTVHVNGHAFLAALAVVDFGQPLKPTKLTPEQSAEVVERLKKLGREILGREANVRVTYDGPNGVYFASVG